MLPSGGLYATYHLLGEPETTIEYTRTIEIVVCQQVQQRCFFHRSRSLVSCSSRFLSNLVAASWRKGNQGEKRRTKYDEVLKWREVGRPTSHHQWTSKETSEGLSLVNRIIIKKCLYLQDSVQTFILDGVCFIWWKDYWQISWHHRDENSQFHWHDGPYGCNSVNGKWLVTITYPHDMSYVSCTHKFNQGKQQHIIQQPKFGWSFWGTFRLLHLCQWACPMISCTMVCPHLYLKHPSHLSCICGRKKNQHTICMSWSQNAKGHFLEVFFHSSFPGG